MSTKFNHVLSSLANDPILSGRFAGGIGAGAVVPGAENMKAEEGEATEMQENPQEEQGAAEALRQLRVQARSLVRESAASCCRLDSISLALTSLEDRGSRQIAAQGAALCSAQAHVAALGSNPEVPEPVKQAFQAFLNAFEVLMSGPAEGRQAPSVSQ